MLQCKRHRRCLHPQAAVEARIEARFLRTRSNLFDDAEAEDADEDKIQRNDVIQQPRHDENENAGNERDDGLKMADVDAHVFSPFGNGEEIRIAKQSIVCGTGILDGSTARMFPACKIFQRRSVRGIRNDAACDALTGFHVMCGTTTG
jgi:hypothetical protein